LVRATSYSFTSKFAYAMNELIAEQATVNFDSSFSIQGDATFTSSKVVLPRNTHVRAQGDMTFVGGTLALADSAAFVTSGCLYVESSAFLIDVRVPSEGKVVFVAEQGCLSVSSLDVSFVKADGIQCDVTTSSTTTKLGNATQLELHYVSSFCDEPTDPLLLTLALPAGIVVFVLLVIFIVLLALPATRAKICKRCGRNKIKYERVQASESELGQPKALDERRMNKNARRREERL